MSVATVSVCALDDIEPGTARKFDVGGVAVGWLVTRRNAARDEESDAWKEVEEHCDGEVVHLEQSARVAQRFGPG